MSLVWQSRRFSWGPCGGRCRAQLFATKERYRCGLPLAGTHRPSYATPFPFLCQKRKWGRPPKEKRAVRNRKYIPCRHRVRRRLLRSASAGAAKVPHPQPPSSFPNCDRSLGHNLVLENSTAPHAILMMADIWLFTDTLCKDGQGLPPLQRKKSTPSGGSDGVPLFIVLLFVSEAVSGANPCRRRSGRR